jgi:tetratricopeptide (TPR) repeat protein
MLAVLVLTCLQNDYIRDLSHQDPEVRRHACVVLGRKGEASTSLPPLIERLGPSETDESVRQAAVEALERLTDLRGYGPDYKKWKDWYAGEGHRRFPRNTLSSEEVQRIVSQSVEDATTKAKEAKSEIRILSITVAIIATAFVLVMIYFVGHVSSKLKEWKELVRQAGVYIEESQQITKRTDRVLEELEAKKIDILEFIKNLKEEKEAEIERYSDLLSQNTEHKMREELMALRQKAEKELEETLGQLRQQIELEIRRLAGDHKDKTERDFRSQNERFLKEVDAHTLFLQAGFFHANNRLEEALKVYRKLLALKPDHQVAWEKMGNAYREVMRFEEALEAYQKAVELNPTDWSAYYNMAATYAAQRRREPMLESLSLAIKNDGEFKEEALNNPAFRDYWNDPAFKDLAEA